MTTKTKRFSDIMRLLFDPSPGPFSRREGEEVGVT